MKIVNVSGRLETRGTWEETEAQAAAQVACIAQQRADLRAMLSGNMQFHEDPHAATLERPSAFQRIMDGGLSDDEHEQLLRMRDGCRCCHPNARPPCGACTEPPTEREAAEIAELSAQVAHAKTTPKPPALWRSAAQIPKAGRGGLWFHRPHGDAECNRAFRPRFDDSNGSYLKAPDGAQSEDPYCPDDYQQPDADGWFTHEPKADSVCPVPAGVEFEAKRRDWEVVLGRQVDDWTIGLPDSRKESPFDIIAWRPVA